MVDPVSITIGIAVSVVGILAAAGLYLAGRVPDHIVNMREVSSYYRHQSALSALEEDVDDDGAE